MIKTPEPRYRSRSKPRKVVKLPSKEYTTHYKRKRYSYDKCAICKKELHGMSSRDPKKRRRTAKSRRAPNRLYGGNLCPSCLRSALINEIRSE
ncbi:MAG: 50S ribosomal protein L34e [Promethearchaeota archaeon]|nr:MAG: 50S ribosomal protein L34e [Candidatus Lokiarchaeota archaeon]